jgi:predicted transcriptional regulator
MKLRKKILTQSASSGRLWENALLENLVDLRERHKIRSPIEGSLRKVVEEKLIEDALISAIAKGCVAVSMISKATELPGNLVRKYTNRMEERGVLKVDRSGNPHRFTLVASPKSK